MTDNREKINELVAKAAEAKDSGDAMRFSQAACNAANALQVLEALKRHGDTLSQIESLANRMDRAGQKMTEYGSACLTEAGKELCGGFGGTKQPSDGA